MLTVYGVSRNPNSDLYELGEGQDYPGFDAVWEYVLYCQQVEPSLQLITEEDEDYDDLVGFVNGRICDQNDDPVIGWRTEDGDVILELVTVH